MKTVFWSDEKIIKSFDHFNDIGFLPRVGDSFSIESLTNKKSYTHYGNGKKKEPCWVFKIKEITLDLKKQQINISIFETIASVEFDCKVDGYAKLAMDK